MKLRIAAGLTFLVLTFVSAPLAAQTFRIDAAIPFSFAVGSQALPSGQYEFQNLAMGVAQIWNQDSRTSVAMMFHPGFMPVKLADESVTLVFHRYGQSYFLSEIRNGYSGSVYSFPESPREKELRRTAFLHRPEETVTLVARAIAATR
jgi:hypothetical protein